MVDWKVVQKAQWLPYGDEGLVMEGTRVVGILGQISFVAWVQHPLCGAWYPLDTRTCLYCQQRVDPVTPS